MTMAENQTTQRKLILGITGGIAAYKAAELVRLLIKQSFDVQVVMTHSACEFITPTTMQALSGKPVYTEMWHSNEGDGMQHIAQSRQCDAILIAPCTADFIAKLAHGQADDLLSTLCLARDCDLMIAPAMNHQMWANPATQRNIKQLKEDNIVILGPDTGEQACGEFGLGRMLEPESLLSAVTAYFTPKLLAGKRVLITAGATMEMIDPVRGITNLSSGKMGYAIARAAQHMGAEVTLVSGISTEPQPANVHFLQANDAALMYETVMSEIKNQDIMIAVAAVADYTPVETSTQKIKKSSAKLNIALSKTKDIIADVASLKNPPFCVGFAAESENLLEYASQKRTAKKLPMIVANLVQDSMGKNEAALTIITTQGQTKLAHAEKPILATQLLKEINNRLPK